ncbi:flagellar biosynthetic protein FliO [bacterium]|nr:flagellar biosynthetic protein FliO [bacterium]
MMKKNLKIWLIFTGIVIIFLLGHAAVLAQPDTGSQTPDESETEMLLPDTPMAEDFIQEESSAEKNTRLGSSYWLNLIVSLAIVIVFIYGLSYVFRYLFARLPAYRGRDEFKVVNSLRLSTNSTLYVIRFLDDIYLLSATPQNVSVVSHISDTEKVQEILDSMSNADGTNPHAFSTLLSRRMTEEIKSDALKDKQQSRADEQRHFEETSNRLKSFETRDEQEDA